MGLTIVQKSLIQITEHFQDLGLIIYKLESLARCTFLTPPPPHHILIREQSLDGPCCADCLHIGPLLYLFILVLPAIRS